jgi:hypothetical protein
VRPVRSCPLASYVAADSALVTATAEGVSRSVTVTVTAPAPPPSASTPVVSSISRQAGSAAGGTRLTITGSGFTTDAEVSFGGVRGRATYVSSTRLDVVSPAHAAGTVAVTVQQGTATASLANAFEYLPAPTRTFVSTGFENGSASPFRAWQTTVTTEAARSGSRSAKSVAPSSDQVADLTFLYGSNAALNESQGVYQRWFVMLPQTTITNVTRGQVKLHLSRYNEERGGGGSWLMIGTGSEFGSAQPGQLTAFIDANVRAVPGSYTPVVLKPGVWHEVQVWYKRINGRGYTKLWVDGVKYLETSDAALGSDGAADNQSFRIGVPWTQHASGPVTVFVDDAASANGYIEP